MRIIGGDLRGIRLNPPGNLPVRPTTDLAKEALFNILANRIDFDGIMGLDLFAGTGNITFEMASRGAAQVHAVDIHFKCLQYIRDTAKRLGLPQIKTTKADVFKFLKSTSERFDFIFADPPYDIAQLPQLPHIIFENSLLNPDGILVVEHPTTRQLASHDAFLETRKYGYSSFSFYSTS